MEYYNRMTNNMHTTQPQNNAGQYDNKPAAPTAPAKDPNAMDVNRQHRRQTVGQGQSQQQRLPLICFKCRKPGHLARNCKSKMDVRAMMYKELVATVKEDLNLKEARKKEDFPNESK